MNSGIRCRPHTPGMVAVANGAPVPLTQQTLMSFWCFSCFECNIQSHLQLSDVMRGNKEEGDNHTNKVLATLSTLGALESTVA
eukprot:m.263317 g.263317  ORF g.263317 m.263317 type:complete len:83 (+) comp19240_c2_seq15:1060-1308(+)